MKLASKSKNRLELLETITEGITSTDIFEKDNFKKNSEDKLKKSIYPNLLNTLADRICDKRGFSKGLAREKAKTMIKIDDGKSQPINTTHFMGTSNKPSITVESSGIKVAIEIKKGDRARNLKESFGESMIFSNVYDFVIYLFLDTTEETRIVKGSSGITENNFLKNLWDNFNVKFTII